MKAVKLYTTSSCPYCIRAKSLLKSKSIPFEEIQVGWDDEAAWKEMEIKSGGMKTVPQIYIGDKCIGGYTELAALDQKGELMKMLA